jgi:hypothetical protein
MCQQELAKDFFVPRPETGGTSEPPLADFFGFFGALKKGDFFGLEAKKVLLNISCGGIRRLAAGKHGFPKALLDTGLRRADGADAGAAALIRSRAESLRPKETADFFWVRPKKVFRARAWPRSTSSEKNFPANAKKSAD